MCLIILPIFALADGCCTYPDASFEFAICQSVPEQICCPDGSQDCLNHFHSGLDCYGVGGSANFDECERGCCCVEEEDGIVASSTTRAGCSGEFHQGDYDTQTCAGICGGDYEELQQIDTRERQCMYYYCKGNQFPEGPKPDASGLNLVYADTVFSGFEGKITAAMRTYNHFWLVNEVGKLFLFDSGTNLVTSDNRLEDFGLDSNPINLSDIHNLESINSMAAISDEPTGQIFFSENNNIYRYTGGGTQGGLTNFYGPSNLGYDRFSFMSSYGSYKFDNFLFTFGLGKDVTFYETSSRENPFQGNMKGEVEALLDEIDAVFELNYEGENKYPCLIYIGSCNLLDGCKADDQCEDFNECTENLCLSDGTCHFSQESDGAPCSGNDFGCCAGVCFNEPANNDFDEECRSDPICTSHYLKYEEDNEGQPCEGDCKTCESGYCIDNDEVCEEEGMCCEDGECVQCVTECYEDDKKCVGDSSYQQCENVEDDLWRFSTDIQECESSVCNRPICEEGGCREEPIAFGESDFDNGCYNDEGCEDGNCNCDGEGNCVSMCDPMGDDCDDGNPCTEGRCNTDTGECDFLPRNGVLCETNGEQGICRNDECEIVDCIENDDCEEISCRDAFCSDGNICKWEPSTDGEECTKESGDLGECQEGYCRYIECQEANDCPDSKCQEKECTGGSCTYTDFVDGHDCEIEGEEETKEGFCHGGDCLISCVSEGCPDDEVCNEETGLCVECMEANDCPEEECKNVTCNDENECTYSNAPNGEECSDGTCFAGNCEENCQDNTQCGGDTPVCSQDIGTCVECNIGSDCPQKDCLNIEGCYFGECRYTKQENGTSCDSCGPGECVCFRGTCINACYDSSDCEETYPFCNQDLSYCTECENENHCDDGNPCTISSCNEGFCEYENLDDYIECNEDGVNGTCCGGVCNTQTLADTYDEECRSDYPSCIGDRLQYTSENEGEICDGECTVCSSGFCDHDNHSICPDSQICNEGICSDCEENLCEIGDSECLSEGRYRECTSENECNVWGEPKNCPDEACQTPSCEDGQCFLSYIPRGDTDSEYCQGDVGCDGGDCRCDGNGNCVSMCFSDKDCDDGNPCTKGFCDNGRCVQEPSQDMQACPGGVCCGGACKLKTKNQEFHESCRSAEPVCDGGSYGYVAVNENENCQGDCSVCVNGFCYDDSSLCGEGQECNEGVCEGCTDSCTEGEKRCANDMVQECTLINDCLVWGKPQECQEDEKCVYSRCVNGNCNTAYVEKGDTDKFCYGFYGCDGNNCRCDGRGNCIKGDELKDIVIPKGEDDFQIIERDKDEIEESERDRREAEKAEEEKSSWILLLILLILLVIILSVTCVYFYDKYYMDGRLLNKIKQKTRPILNNISSKINGLINKTKNTGNNLNNSIRKQTNSSTKKPINQYQRQGPGKNMYQGQPNRNSQHINNQQPRAYGTVRDTPQTSPLPASSDNKKELMDYIQTLKTKGPDKRKELELQKKGVTREQLLAAYKIARRENEKRLGMKNMLSKFDEKNKK